MIKDRKIYILCGGQSLRMGRDKYDLEINGQTFLKALTDRVESYFDEVCLLGSDHLLNTRFKQIPDYVKDAGPLGGLLAAMNHSDEKLFAIVPIDLPLISSENLKRLSEIELNNKDALIAKSENRVQPLLGVYRTNLSDLLEEYLTTGKRSVMGFLDQIDVEPFEISSAELMNVNTPEEYQKLISTIE